MTWVRIGEERINLDHVIHYDACPKDLRNPEHLVVSLYVVGAPKVRGRGGMWFDPLELDDPDGSILAQLDAATGLSWHPADAVSGSGERDGTEVWLLR